MIVFRSVFARQIEDMIAYKNALGYSASSYRFHLHNFDKYCAERFTCETELSQEIVMDWCRKRENETINSLNRRLAVIREFGKYLLSIGQAAYIMPPKMTATQTRYVPHIYTDYELSRFFYGADSFGETTDDLLRSYIIPVIFRMVYCCGLRPNEGLSIRNEDIDLKSGRVFIRASKRHKDRVVMLSDDLLMLCNKYNYVRSRFSYGEGYFFPDRHGHAHNMPWLERYFKKCWKIAEVNFTNPKPRIYDFRHTFATRRLHDWMDENIDLYKMLPYLSAYMGHSNFTITAYYIHLIPERLKNSPAMDWKAFDNLIPEVTV